MAKQRRSLETACTNVLHEFRAVGFDPFPFLRGADSFIGDGFAAETVFSDTGLDVGKSCRPEGRLDEEHPASDRRNSDYRGLLF